MSVDKVSILIKYGELTLKGKNAKVFKDVLAKNIRRSFKGVEYELKVSYSRIYLEIASSNLKLAIDKLKTIYGIHSFATYVSCENDIDVIKKVALEYTKDLDYKTFKVDTKRKNKKFAITSTEVSRIVGGCINQNTEMNVDVFNPEITIKLEIRNSEALVYFNEYKGLGGLPVGVSGKSLLMLSGGIDSPIAGYLINKRGVKFNAIHFTSPPYTAQESIDKVTDLCDKLRVYNGDFILYLVKFTKVQEALLKMKKDSYFITIMRRIMYRIASRIADDKDYKAIVNGDSIGQVASQTLESMNVVDNVATLPILRPLAIFDKSEVISIAKEIDTYDISIRAFEDCCTTFIPKSPVIKPNVRQCEILEHHLEIEELIAECIDSIEIIKVGKKNDEFQTLL